MNNEEHTEKESRRHGPPGMHGGMEKPKNLKKAINSRLKRFQASNSSIPNSSSSRFNSCYIYSKYNKGSNR